MILGPNGAGKTTLLDRPVKAASYGNRRQLEVGLALATRPKILLMDELTSAVGPSMIDGFHQLLLSLPQDLTVRAGTVHALLGRNEVGKSTTLKSAIGHLALSAGTITFDGTVISNCLAHDVSRMGVSYVPETRDIFGALTVRENLVLAGPLAAPESDWAVERVTDFFPNLARRMTHGGHELSGCEQQKLAIGRALMTGPRILLLDEATEGLAPIVIQQIFGKLKELKASGLTILLVEQNLNFALGLADEVSLMSRDRIVWRGTAADLRRDSRPDAGSGPDDRADQSQCCRIHVLFTFGAVET
ncbi:ATP-binding cassette domain-containing protein [Rhodobacteraceae bacterium F11138]|nr:ATP-binding cassette domain-containing protein [Rhodobacteraceae bacterium F11138]